MQEDGKTVVPLLFYSLAVSWLNAFHSLVGESKYNRLSRTILAYNSIFVKLHSGAKLNFSKTRRT